MRRILIIFGTRPEAIKMAPLYFKLLEDRQFDVRVCVTGQHREMLHQVLEFFEITPEYDLELMQTGQSLHELFGQMMIGLEKVLNDFEPDLIMVHGDTSTTCAATLSGYYQKTKVAHVEAGLRTGNSYSPWPEEGNRRMVGAIATLHFAPTSGAANNLYLENIAKDRVYVTGNTVVDALNFTMEKINTQAGLQRTLQDKFHFIRNFSQMILVTSHRRENHGSGLANIAAALKEIAISRPDILVIFPMHLNPVVRNVFIPALQDLNNVKIIEPVMYHEFVYLMSESDLILTDSGGIQEEAPSLGVPLLLMRDTTERPEGVDAGVVILVGTDPNVIVSSVHNALSGAHVSKIKNNPFGDGLSADRICEVIKLLKD